MSDETNKKPAKPPHAFLHASKSLGPINCNIRLRHQNMVYPRTCKRCGLFTPCPFFYEDGEVKLNGA